MQRLRTAQSRLPPHFSLAGLQGINRPLQDRAQEVITEAPMRNSFHFLFFFFNRAVGNSQQTFIPLEKSNPNKAKKNRGWGLQMEPGGAGTDTGRGPRKGDLHSTPHFRPPF